MSTSQTRKGVQVQQLREAGCSYLRTKNFKMSSKMDTQPVQ